MLELPKTTEFNRKIPKKKFYENLTITPALRNSIKDGIKAIYWRNKIDSTTTNLAKGTVVTEIEVFEIKLNSSEIDENVLKQIDKEIPYHILYIISYENNAQVWIGYKEVSQKGSNAFKVNGYYHTDWLALDEIDIKLDGLSVDEVYENFIRQIAGEQIQNNNGETLEESIERAEKIKELKKQIDKLQIKIRKEKQFNRQVELNTELKKIKKELENYQ